jgi:flavodoxin
MMSKTKNTFSNKQTITMNTLVVTYSQGGNNKLLANIISERTKGDFDEIRTGNRTKKGSFFRKLFCMNNRVSYEKDVSHYQHIIICTTSGNGELPLPVKMYVSRHPHMEYSLATVCGTGQLPLHERVLKTSTHAPRAFLQLLIAKPPEHITTPDFLLKVDQIDQFITQATYKHRAQ